MSHDVSNSTPDEVKRKNAETESTSTNDDDNDVRVEHGENQRIIHAELGEMTELESLCPRCEKNGTTRLMITDVPYFKKIIVSSFNCTHCGERNVETQFGGEYGPKRTRHHLHIRKKEDMSRQVVKSEHAILKIPELQLEIPPETQRGSLNTVEGVLAHTIEGLMLEQPVRKVMQPDFAAKIEEFCTKLEEYRSGDIPFSIILDDPAGNSFVEPRYDYYHPTIDPQLSLFAFTRTKAEREALGLSAEGIDDDERIAASKNSNTNNNNSATSAAEASTSSSSATEKNNNSNNNNDKKLFEEKEGEVHDASATVSAAYAEAAANSSEGIAFAAAHQKRQSALGSKVGTEMYNTLRTQLEEEQVDSGELPEIFEMTDNCPACHHESQIRMHPVDIPHFRETIIMAFKCDNCGYKSTEVQTGGAIPDKGRKIVLTVEDDSDLKRDVLKSNSASLLVPELDLELVPGTLGGFFTTIQGLLNQVYEQLNNTRTSCMGEVSSDLGIFGDSKAAEAAAANAYDPDREGKMQTSMEKWLERLKNAVEGNIFPLTVILDDPLAGVYVQNPRSHLPPPQNEDPRLKVDDYVRTDEQNEDLGLNDMKV